MQFWRLSGCEGRGTFSCMEDSGRPPAITQEIPFTDFPLGEVQLWVELGSVDGVNPVYVAMLPSER